MNIELSKALANWEGTHTQYLKDLYQKHVSQSNFFADLVQISLKHPTLQPGATWLIKHHFDQGRKVEQAALSPLLSNPIELKAWEAQLHLLQILPHLPLTVEFFPPLESFVRSCLSHTNKFVRAWAYQGMYELSNLVPELKPELITRCQQALEEESASVKVRVRKVLEKIEKEV